MDPEIGILRSGLQQQHGMFAVGAQAVSEHTSGRAGADDDVIEFGSLIIIVHFVSPVRNTKEVAGLPQAVNYQLPRGRRGEKMTFICGAAGSLDNLPRPGMTTHLL